MTPAYIYCSEDVLPYSKFKRARGAIIWDRNGQRRFIPAGRVRSYHTLVRLQQQFTGPDSPTDDGIPWSMTEEYKPYGREY